MRTTRRRLGRHTGVGLAFVAPFTVLLVAFLVLPLAYAFKLSLYRSTLIEGEVFTLFDNYRQAFADPLFRSGVVRVVGFGLIQTPVMIGLALVAALIIDGVTSRLSRAFRLAAFVPYAVPAVIGTLMWGFLYSPNTGPLSSLFGQTDFLPGPRPGLPGQCRHLDVGRLQHDRAVRGAAGGAA